MTLERKYKKQAFESCAWREHDMSNFVKLSDRIFESKCRWCDAWVQVNVRPLPNQIEVGGPAVALNCPVHL
jgi:hypothetical protein